MQRNAASGAPFSPSAEKAYTFALLVQSGNALEDGGPSLSAMPSRFPQRQLSESTAHDDEPASATYTFRPLYE